MFPSQICFAIMITYLVFSNSTSIVLACDNINHRHHTKNVFEAKAKYPCFQINKSFFTKYSARHTVSGIIIAFVYVICDRRTPTDGHRLCTRSQSVKGGCQENSSQWASIQDQSQNGRHTIYVLQQR